MSSTLDQETQSSEGPIVLVDEAQPWALWQPVEERDTTPSLLSLSPYDGEDETAKNSLTLASIDGGRYVASLKAVESLGRLAGFPADFVGRLPVGMRADVINERLSKLPPEEPLSVVLTANRTDTGFGRVYSTSVNERRRRSMPHAWVAQAAWNTMTELGFEGLRVADARSTGDGMIARFASSMGMPISPNGRAVGDVLSLGIEVVYIYAVSIESRLYLERLACLNGMTAHRVEFNWKQAFTGSVEEQLAWVRGGVAEAINAFPQVVDRARRMHATPLTGDPERLVAERARIIGLRPTQVAEVLRAYREEPEATEWGALNAITRFATHHGSVSPHLRTRLQRAAGRWVGEFDVVSARLPRSLAEAVGATIVEEA